MKNQKRWNKLRLSIPCASSAADILAKPSNEYTLFFFYSFLGWRVSGRIHMAYAWNMLGIYMTMLRMCNESARNMHGISIEHAWNMHEYAWKMKGICLEYAWNTHSICLEYAYA